MHFCDLDRKIIFTALQKHPIKIFGEKREIKKSATLKSAADFLVNLIHRYHSPRFNLLYSSQPP